MVAIVVGSLFAAIAAYARYISEKAEERRQHELARSVSLLFVCMSASALLRGWDTPLWVTAPPVVLAAASMAWNLREVILYAIVSARKIAIELEHFQLLTDAATDGFWEWDIATGRDLWSERSYRTLGYTDPATRRTRTAWLSLMHPADVERAQVAIGAHIRDGTPYAEVLRFRRADGAWAWILERGVAIRDKEGQICRVIGTHTDITELKQSEEALRQTNRDLEQFAFSASHDLQEPLRMISSWTTALFEDHGDKLTSEDALKTRHYIVDGVARLRALIQDLLRFSRAGQNIHLVPIHLAPVVARAISSMRGAIESAQGSVALSEDMPSVLADESVLRQAIYNILSNCVKFKRADEPLRISVSAKQGDGRVLVEITDNGLGIALEHQRAVFEVFKRLYSAEEYPGTGIGLALVRRIVHAHGGEVGVRSEGAGTGTTVWFTLKAAKQKKSPV